MSDNAGACFASLRGQLLIALIKCCECSSRTAACQVIQPPILLYPVCTEYAPRLTHTTHGHLACRHPYASQGPLCHLSSLLTHPSRSISDTSYECLARLAGRWSQDGWPNMVMRSEAVGVPPCRALHAATTSHVKASGLRLGGVQGDGGIGEGTDGTDDPMELKAYKRRLHKRMRSFVRAPSELGLGTGHVAVVVYPEPRNWTESSPSGVWGTAWSSSCEETAVTTSMVARSAGSRGVWHASSTNSSVPLLSVTADPPSFLALPCFDSVC